MTPRFRAIDYDELYTGHSTRRLAQMVSGSPLGHSGVEHPQLPDGAGQEDEGSGTGE